MYMSFAEYEADCIRAENKSLWISERAGEYLDGAFNPYKTKNIIEAMQNMNKTDREDLDEILDEKNVDYEEVGKFITSISFDYWERRADEEAERDFDNQDDGFIEPYNDGWTAEHQAIANWAPRGW